MKAITVLIGASARLFALRNYYVGYHEDAAYYFNTIVNFYFQWELVRTCTRHLSICKLSMYFKSFSICVSKSLIYCVSNDFSWAYVEIFMLLLVLSWTIIKTSNRKRAFHQMLQLHMKSVMRNGPFIYFINWRSVWMDVHEIS